LSLLDFRADDDLPEIKQTQFGLRRVCGELVESPEESETLTKMKALRNQGYSYRDIVQILNSLMVPCRNNGAKWHIKTVYGVLNR
jgi:hypothetical protein